MPKRTAKHLTAADVKNAKPKDKPYELRDAGQKGLLLRLQPSGTKSWVVVYTVAGRKNRKTLGDASKMTLARARTLASKTGADADEGIDRHAEQRRAKKAIFGSYLEGAFREYAEANIATHKGTLAGLKKNFSFILSRPMAEINEVDMARWKKNRSGVSLETQRRELTNLKVVLNHAVKNKVIPGHQLTHYRVAGTVQEGMREAEGAGGHAKRYLDADEETRLRAALDAREAKMRRDRDNGNAHRQRRGKKLLPDITPGQYADHIKPLVLLALNTGLRRSDLLGLKWGHVDLELRQIRKVIQKTSHTARKAGKKLVPAVLPLSPEAHTILSQWKKQRNPDSEYVFPSPRTDGRMEGISTGFGSIIEAAEIPDFRFHDLRHTFASQLVMAGTDLNTVRELMTHADIKMTLVYAHLSPDHKAAALERAFPA